MTEERFTELLGKRLSGEINAEELAEFSQLISSNEAYRKEYESLVMYWQQDEKPYDRIADIFEEIKSRTDIPEREAEASIQVRRMKSRFSLVRKIAAVLFILIVSAGTYKVFSGKFSDKAETEWKQLETPSRQLSSLHLPDGTKITLNSESVLKYPVAFKGNSREVYLTGEAYFEVTSDHKHPFIVHTDKMNIRVLGTAFNVKSYMNDRTEEATLLRGSIQVTFPDNPNEKVLLKPADKIVLKDSNYHLEKQSYYNQQDSSIMEILWMTNKLAFKNETFETIANQLSRKYGVKIVFTNNSLRDLKFTGEFEKETLNQALFSLQLVTPFRYRVKGNNVYLY
jgi:ferric-dicitrate binding protein FerR (iron transport regulator)